MDSRAWFKSAKFGMMVHWGLYSLIGGEWRGERMDYIGEWAQSHFQIPNREYEKLAAAFNPIYFDADEWVSIAKSAGMEYIVVTSKHHEGFCLFDSEYDSFNSVKATPFGRDIIAELAAACKRQGMKLGLYYSQDLDWHEPNGGGCVYTVLNHDYMSWTNNWDYPDPEKKDYDKLFRTKILTQVREILTKYGDLCLIWFDTPRGITKAQSQELYDLVKSIQPNCLVNTRIGNGLGDYRSMGDNEVSDNYFGDALVETPATLNDTWGYKHFDNNWKSADEVIRIKNHLNERGVNDLLNVGPDHLGRIPAPAVKILREVGEKSGVKC